MTETFEYAARPGSASLSVLSFIGLGTLAMFLWYLAPGYVMLLLIPALAACVWQVMNVPTFGIRMTESSWQVISGDDDLVVPVSHISYLRMVERAGESNVGLMLTDGTEIQLPSECLPERDELFEAAAARGIAVREAA